MKKIIKNFLFFIAIFSLANCGNKPETKTQNHPYKFYKFFDPFSFNGIQETDSAIITFPYCKVYFDSSNNIIEINNFLSDEEQHSYLVKHQENQHIIYSSTDETHLNIFICLICDSKQVIKIHNYNFRETPDYTNFVSILKPHSEITYNYYTYDIPLDNKRDSLLLNKIVFVNPNLVNIDTLHFKEKIFRTFESNKDSIKVVTKTKCGDSLKTEIKSFSKIEFDNFWLFQYNCNL